MTNVDVTTYAMESKALSFFVSDIPHGKIWTILTMLGIITVKTENHVTTRLRIHRLVTSPECTTGFVDVENWNQIMVIQGCQSEETTIIGFLRGNSCSCNLDIPSTWSVQNDVTVLQHERSRLKGFQRSHLTSHFYLLDDFVNGACAQTNHHGGHNHHQSL